VNFYREVTKEKRLCKREKFGFEGVDREVDGSIPPPKQRREKEKEREREKEGIIDPTRLALLLHTRANPLVFGFSGKTAR